MIPKPMTDEEREEIYAIINRWDADGCWNPKPSAADLVKRLRDAGYPIVHWSDIVAALLKGEE